MSNSSFNLFTAANALNDQELNPAERLGLSAVFTKMVNNGIAQPEDKPEAFDQFKRLNHVERAGFLLKAGWDINLPPQNGNEASGGWRSSK